MLTPGAIEELTRPYLCIGVMPESHLINIGPDLFEQLAVYLQLILRWNDRTNLTAIRQTEEIVRRHFGESLFAGLQIDGLVVHGGTVLDFGSGAGFPGLPIQLLRPDAHITLAESQGKKAAFLREVVRSLGLQTEVWSGRVENMPAERRFDVVAMRAVDSMTSAVVESTMRATEAICIITTSSVTYPELSAKFELASTNPIPGSRDGTVLLATPTSVPRGTTDKPNKSAGLRSTWNKS